MRVARDNRVGQVGQRRRNWRHMVRSSRVPLGGGEVGGRGRGRRRRICLCLWRSSACGGSRGRRRRGCWSWSWSWRRVEAEGVELLGTFADGGHELADSSLHGDHVWAGHGALGRAGGCHVVSEGTKIGLDSGHEAGGTRSGVVRGGCTWDSGAGRAAGGDGLVKGRWCELLSDRVRVCKGLWGRVRVSLGVGLGLEEGEGGGRARAKPVRRCVEGEGLGLGWGRGLMGMHASRPGARRLWGGGGHVRHWWRGQ